MTKTRFKVNKFDLFKTVNNSVIWLSDAPEFIEVEGEIVEEELPKRIDLGFTPLTEKGVIANFTPTKKIEENCSQCGEVESIRGKHIHVFPKKIEKIEFVSTKKTHGLIDVFDNQIELAQKINEIIDHLNHE